MDLENSGNGKVAAQDLLHTFMPHGKSRIFVHPGKDVLELLMRTVFASEDQAIAAVMLYDKCMKYNFKRGLEDLKALLAARCSIGGRSTSLALMAETGVVAPGVLETHGKPLSRKGRPPSEDRKDGSND